MITLHTKAAKIAMGPTLDFALQSNSSFILSLIEFPKMDGSEDRWRDMDLILTRGSNLAGPGFEPGPELRDFLQSEDCRVLCVGAGGLGCEILKVSLID